MTWCECSHCSQLCFRNLLDIPIRFVLPRVSKAGTQEKQIQEEQNIRTHIQNIHPITTKSHTINNPRFPLKEKHPFFLS